MIRMTAAIRATVVVCGDRSHFEYGRPTEEFSIFSNLAYLRPLQMSGLRLSCGTK